LEQARNLYVEKIALAEQLVDYARRKGSRQDIGIFEKGAELYKRTYAKLVAECQQQSSQAKAYQLDAELEQSDQELAKLLSPQYKSRRPARNVVCCVQSVYFKPSRGSQPALRTC